MRRLRASGAPQWKRCPGSVAAQEGLPDKSSGYALEGTCAHRLAELSWAEDRPPQDYLGHELDLPDGTWTVDQEMVTKVQEYLDNVERLASGANFQFVEVDVPISQITGEYNDDGSPATGQVDRLALFIGEQKATVQVHDLKYGKGVVVEAKENEQLICYAHGVLEWLGWMLDGLMVDIEIYIHQPRLNALPEWKTTEGVLNQRAAGLRAAADKTRQEDAERIPGEKQCRFCKAYGTERCPESTQYVAESATLDPDDVEALDYNWELIQFVEKWAKKARARIQEALENGEQLNSVKLVAGKSSRNWKEDDETVAKKLQNRGLKAAEVWNKSLISAAQAEKKLGKERYSKLAAELVEKKEGKPTLASADDKRPAVNSAEALGFSEIE